MTAPITQISGGNGCICVSDATPETRVFKLQFEDMKAKLEIIGV